MAYENRRLKSGISGYHNSCWVTYLDNFLYLIKNEPKAIGKSNLPNLPTIIMTMHWQKLGLSILSFEYY